MTKGERAKVAKKCGSRCFAGPNRSYPMCSKDSRVCGTDCMGARAAFSRARQYKKPKIALKAAKAGKKAGCSWVRGKAAQSVLKSGLSGLGSSKSLQREAREIVKALKHLGWSVRTTTSNHYKALAPDKTIPIIIIPKTPSDHRSLKNLKSVLRRHGVSV